MKLNLFVSVLVALLVLPAISLTQDLIQFPAASLELQIQGDGGRNGAAVTYNPEKQLYYAVMAGNAEYPLETFSKNGKNLYQSQAYSDMRGLWWNPKEEALEGNCYADGGIVAIGLTEQGYAGDGNRVIIAGGYSQPSEQAVGFLDTKKKEILYLTEGIVVGYSRKDGVMTKTFLWLDIPAEYENINWTTAVFTGVPGMELGVLDFNNNKVYLFDRKHGYHTGTVNLPAGATTYEAFNFSYANGYVFLFDQDARKWKGYRIFEF
jgi:hypothetical protein